MNIPRLITEWTNFEYDPSLIKEQKAMGKPMMMKGILQKAETLNQNGRVYPKIILEREIRNYQKFIKNNFKYVGKNFAYEARSIHYNSHKKKDDLADCFLQLIE